jgi:6-phosphogluconolactonase (cycloisomerase 2 family)
MSVGQLTALSPAFVSTGLGGHKVCASPDGKHVYVANESAKTVTMYSRGAGGALTALGTPSIAAGAAPCDIQITPDGKHVYVADGPGSTTVHAYSRNAETGLLTLVEAAAANAAPRNLVISPDGKYLYASNSTTTTITQFSRNESTGKLTQLSPATVTVGTEPRGICMSPDGKNIYTGNFGSKNVSQLKRNPETGLCEALAGGPLEASTGADIIVVSPDGLNVYVTDFGKFGGPWGTTVHQFSRGSEGKLAALSPATVTCGEGPTDLTCSGDGKDVYVCCFNGGSLQVFTRGTEGKLTLAETKTTGKEMEGVCLSPDETNVYSVLWEGTGEATHGRIYQFHRTPLLGQLTPLSPKDVECQEEPQHVTVSPDNKFVYVANAKSGTISCYKRGAGGVLEALATRDVATGAGAYDISISPDGKHLYVCNREAAAAKAISQYSRNLSTGVITALSPANVEMKGVVAGAAEGKEHAGPHSIVMSDDGKFVYVCTQSKPGRVYQYARNTSTGLLTPLSTEFFTTTRMLFDLRLTPAAGNPYVFGALLGVLFSKEAGEVIVFKRDETTGLLTSVETVSAGTSAECSGSLIVSPDGKHLYVTNKEPVEGGGPEEPHTHGVSAFSIGAGGKLTLLEQYATYEEPRGIFASPDGRNIYVCDQGQRYIHCFDRDPETGLLALKETADTGDTEHFPSHGSVTPNGINYYAADKHISPPKVSQFSRLAGLPMLTKPGTTESTKGVAASLQVAATNTETYEASGLPAGLSIDAVSGLITGTPTTAEEPTVTLTAKGTGGEAKVTFKWKIVASAAPTVTKPANQLSTVGVPISLAIEATNTTEYKASGLPEGSIPEPITINSSTGVITGNPGKVQKVTVTITVKGAGGEASTTFTWTVEAAPTIIKPADQVSHVSESVSLQVEPGAASYKATGLPAGLSINEATGLITGTPTTVSSKTVTIKTFNAAGAEASTTFVWTIEAALPPEAPTVTKPADQTSEQGVPVSLFVGATNTTEYKATGLPAGLSINSATGQITGAATTVGAAKTVTLTVKGAGGEASTTFKWTVVTPAAPPVVVPQPGQKPPLELQTELVYPDGTTARWDRDSRLMKDRPTGITLRTQRYTGYADGQLALARRIDIDYPDLGLLDGINMIGHDGSVAYEGRVATLPRSLEGAPQVGVQAQGWMSHAKDEPFVEVYVDRDLSKWTTPGRARTAGQLAENRSQGSVAQANDEAGSPSVELAFQDAWVSPYKPVVEAWWLPQPGITIGELYYSLTGSNPATMSTADANWFVEAYLTGDDKGSGLDGSGSLWFPPHSGYITATAARTAAFLQLLYLVTPAGSAGAAYNVQFEKLAVYGSHGLMRRGEDPGGFFVSDMVVNFLNRFAPKLDTSGIQETTFAVPHASFLSDTFGYDAWQTLNAYHRWEMAVYEQRKALYWPIDVTDYDWEVRLSDFGTTCSLQGDDTAALCNGVIVRYTDLDTGYETRLSPDDFPELKDESPDNPINLNGLRIYTTLPISVPTTKEGAIQMGRAYLAEFNRPKAPGSITVSGHIRDRAGHWQPGWKVRSSDRLIISDLPSDSVRIVGETSWDHDSKQLKIAVDSSFKEVDAILARLGVAVEASGLSLP